MKDKEMREVFKENLRYFLEINGWSQADMARKLGVSTATAAKWATGESMPRVDKINKLADWFGIKSSDLLEPRENEPYYDNSKSRELAEFLYKNPEYSVLFDACRNISPEDIEYVKLFIERFGGKN